MNDMPAVPPRPSQSVHFHFPAMPHKSLVILIGALVIGAIGGYFIPKGSQTISVVAAGTLTVHADRAIISGSFESIAKSKTQALAENQKKVEKLKADLVAQGLSEKALTKLTTTAGVNYSDESEPLPLSSEEILETPTPTCLGNCPGGRGGSGGSGKIAAPKTNSYTATTNFEISLTKNDFGKIEKLSEVINTQEPLQNLETRYSVTNPARYDAQLREQALNNGRRKADMLAQTTGLRVKKILTIHEQQDPYVDESDQYDSYTADIPLYEEYEFSYEIGPRWLPF